MDESLSDFQEPKKKTAAPKPKPKVKPKKAPKRIRGQKDIRSVLKGKKELESYSKDFDKVCKKAGINIDSEELQLAIAVSKSLQNELSTSQSESVTSQERIGKIRTTLQEYGFKVPEIKITAVNRKQKRKKNYKLIVTPDTEKKELIANKYSEILLKNKTHNLDNEDINTLDYKNIWLYHLATSADYSTLKTLDTFYVENLIEKTFNSGNLLRDWSTIPGRATSPERFEPSDMNFNEIECSQEEIDVVLSGTLKNCKNIIQMKGSLVSYEASREGIDDNDVNKNNCDINNDDEIEKYSNYEKTIVNVNENQEMYGNKQSRSFSPDIFDDDVSILDESYSTEDNTKSLKVNENILVTEETQNESENYVKNKTFSDNLNIDLTNSNTTKRKSNDYMDITDCIQIGLNHNNLNDIKTKSNKNLNTDILTGNITKRKTNEMKITDCIEIETNHISIDLPLSQRNDVTKRKSNDMTECVATSSQPLIIKDRIDLTQILEESVVGTSINKESVKSNDTLPNLTAGANIDLTDSPDNENSIIKNKELDKKAGGNEDNDIDLTQSSNSDYELPFVSLTSKSREISSKIDKSLDDTIVLDLNEYPGINKNNNKAEVHIDLTQNNDSTIEINKLSQSFFDEYEHNHSDERNSNSDESLGKYNTDSPNKNSSFNHSFDQNESNYVEIQNVRNTSSKEDHVNLTLSPIHKPNDGNISDIDLTQNSKDSDVSPFSSQIELIINDSMRQDSNVSTVEDCLSPSKNNGRKESYASPSKNSLSNIESNASTSKTSKSIESYASTSKNSQSYSSLGKRGDVSIDYDEVSKASEHCTEEKSYELDPSQNTNCSQNSAFQISDRELDYSMHKSRLERPDNFEIGGLSIIDNLSNLASFKKSVDNAQEVNENTDLYKPKELSPIKHRRITEIATPQKASTITVVTPKNSEFIIKTHNVTPMLDYETMSTPDIHKELDKYGIKPFKRKRAIQLLTHIYNQTHPIVENCDEFASPPKRHKPNDFTSPIKRISPRKLLQSPKKARESDKSQEDAPNIRNKHTGNRTDSQTNVFQVTTSTEIECKTEDWVFQKREKAKVHSCRVPLHIAFYNYVRSRSDLREAVLRYEPVNIDDIHKDLVACGHRYDPKDLLKFLDKKCITVKTTDNDARNNKR